MSHIFIDNTYLIIHMKIPIHNFQFPPTLIWVNSGTREQILGKRRDYETYHEKGGIERKTVTIVRA